MEPTITQDNANDLAQALDAWTQEFTTKEDK